MDDFFTINFPNDLVLSTVGALWQSVKPQLDIEGTIVLIADCFS